MRAAVFYQPLDVRIEEKATPAIGEGEVLIEVSACGVCGTDRHIFEGSYPARFPVVPGHEFAGVVVDLGPDVMGFSKGDRVCVDPNIPCGKCYFCRAGKIHFCTQQLTIGQHIDGAYAPLTAVLASQVYRLPDKVTLDQGAMVEPVACALHGIDQAQIEPGDTVVVLGAGAIGLILMQLARAAGAAKIIVSEPLESRRNLALELGADLTVDPFSESLTDVVKHETSYGANVAIEAAGVAETAQQAIGLVEPTGTVLIFGACSPKDEIVVHPYDIYRRELRIVGAFVNPFTMNRAMVALATGKVKVDPLFTHRMPITQTEEAMTIHGRGESVKILMYPDYT